MKRITVGLLGFGTVGQGTADILRQNCDVITQRTGVEIVVKKALVKCLSEVNPLPVGIEVVTDPSSLIDDPDIDIIVEVMGGYEPARTYSLLALQAGKHVVTANKACVAKHYRELLEAAQLHGVDYLFEASVAGGIPIIKALKESLAGNRIETVQGIINGTANYILTQMTQNSISFYEALAQAQQLGYAEADPTFDIEGIDAAHKIFILALLCWGVELNFDDLYTEGISSISPVDIELAQELGNTIKLLAIAEPEADGRIDIRVHPTMIPSTYPLAAVDGVFNAVYLEADALGPAMFYGRGAGKMPTGSAVVADIIDLARDMACGVAGKRIAPFSFATLRPAQIVPIDEIHSSFYVRFTVKDTVGVMREISRILADNDISVASAIQKGRSNDSTASVPFVVITHEASGLQINKSIREIENLGITTAPTVMIRVEE
ncbi:homoserine dehydrogenase [Chrysiogenes arsenatis]|uniref:homoserine dehydrogenase n=1 Tax=Chrysiogenes arsenatis TaxID=309797 RepID=UPI00041B3BDD|nr:homoserine dehydrogenase [Chrysiogenes arsenatis]